MMFEERPIILTATDTVDDKQITFAVTAKAPYAGQFIKERIEFCVKAEGGASVKFDMTADAAILLATDIIKQARLATTAKNILTDNIITFKSAQMSCISGLIGKLKITKLADVKEQTEIGFAYYKLEYFGDVEVGDVMYEVDGIKMFFPLTEEAQYDYLRSLVGGVHQYTTQIAIDLANFTLEEINAEMISTIAETFRQK